MSISRSNIPYRELPEPWAKVLGNWKRKET